MIKTKLAKDANPTCISSNLNAFLRHVGNDPLADIFQFASADIMRHYGYLLDTFRTNPEHVNDALFTMMHHISGDLNRPEALYVPHILKVSCIRIIGY